MANFMEDLFDKQSAPPEAEAGQPDSEAEKEASQTKKTQKGSGECSCSCIWPGQKGSGECSVQFYDMEEYLDVSRYPLR